MNTHYIAFKGIGQSKWSHKGEERNVFACSRDIGIYTLAEQAINVKSEILNGVNLEEFSIILELMILTMVSHGAMMKKILLAQMFRMG